MKCSLCPRKCDLGELKNKGKGYCIDFGKGSFATAQGEDIRLARAGLHMWEEPCISGINGSGTIFFSGCSLRCVYCQNYEISHEGIGKEITRERLGEIFDELAESGAHNINLVSSTHYVQQIYELFDKGYKKKIPFVYNSSGYESVNTIKKLDGIIDIYMPDIKYFDKEISFKYSNVPDYFLVAIRAVEEMYSQKGNLQFDDQGIAQKGVLIRHLVLPGYTKDSKDIINSIEEYFSNKAYMSIMSQYIPAGRASEYSEINRKLMSYEYKKVCDYCQERGFQNVYVQSKGAAKESYVPMFDLSGI